MLSHNGNGSFTMFRMDHYYTSVGLLAFVITRCCYTGAVAIDTCVIFELHILQRQVDILAKEISFPHPLAPVGCKWPRPRKNESKEIVISFIFNV